MASITKKLLYNKNLTDYGKDGTIARWKLNPWKIFFAFIGIALLCTVVYGYFFSDDPQNFFGNLLFYIIVIAVTIAILYILASTVAKFRKLIVGFLIAFILIFVFYWLLGVVFTYTGLIQNWYYGGWSLIVILIALAGIGAKRIDGELDKADVFYGFLVFLVLVGINLPIANNMGFLANLDAFISKIIGLSPWKL